MNDKVCIPKSTFLIIFLFFCLLTFIHNLRMEKLFSSKNNIIIVKDNDTTKNNSKLKKSKETNNNQDIDIDIDLLLERDKKSLNNDFSPPERRLPRHIYPTQTFKRSINIPTRGYPDNYHNVGMLVRKNDEKILKLFGRQKYPGSSQWEYYVTGSDTYGADSKTPLNVPGNKELSNNDLFTIPWLDQSKGKFEVKIFDYDAPRYNPFVF